MADIRGNGDVVSEHEVEIVGRGFLDEAEPQQGFQPGESRFCVRGEELRDEGRETPGVRTDKASSLPSFVTAPTNWRLPTRSSP